ncbi:Six-hairpin glycosidase-like protein [Daedaleopsis nitida]|nr:Six-hairpin glycosidase-like protein [Daedaleopsis nitida]
MSLSRRVGEAVVLGSAISSAVAAPSGFPGSGNGLWFTQQGRFEAWSNDWLPIGNGYIAAMVQGAVVQEALQLNLESLWSGGPFQDPSYNGGNKVASDRVHVAEEMQTIRQSIFDSPTGTIDNVEELTTDAGAYGSYVGAGYFLSTLDTGENVSNFVRWLDMDAAVTRTQWTQSNTTFLREAFCSHPSQACVQHLNTSDSSGLPALTYAYTVAAESGIPTPIVSCLDSSTLMITGTASDPGMAFEILARARASPGATIACTPVGSGNATLSLDGASAVWLTWVGGTDFDQDAGDEAHGFSFKGADPHDSLVKLLDAATLETSAAYDEAFAAHVADYSSLMTRFHLDIGQEPDFESPTDALKEAYQTDTGNTYLEWLLFNFGRYLLAGSARGVLPANLQGKWAKDSSNPWGADSNINIQMNYWFAEMTGMDVVKPLFDYFEKNWVPRGTQTAQNLYNISEGWVTHNEIFGHTGMKGGGNTAQWADYPEANAWMMIHVWDHFDFTQDQPWFQSQGWPLLKSTAQFHLHKLIPDDRFNDSTLVVNPCNSPEQAPITLGCAHAQQLIWQLFNAIVKGFPASGDTDTDFLDAVKSKLSQMDKGIHIGSWGQLQEWKVDMDSPTDTHRHLSHLIGLYPGYALSSFNPTYQSSARNYTREEVLAAAEVSLIHRGNGTADDGDAGWEKVWRAACWAQLGNATAFYHQLSYALERNYAPNLISLYSSGPDAIFQIDANFGFPAALLNALVQAPDQPSLSEVYQVDILPALPAHWTHGSITNARLRGGLAVSFEWDERTLKSVEVAASAVAPQRAVRFMQAGKELKTVRMEPGMRLRIL